MMIGIGREFKQFQVVHKCLGLITDVNHYLINCIGFKNTHYIKVLNIFYCYFLRILFLYKIMLTGYYLKNQNKE